MNLAEALEARRIIDVLVGEEARDHPETVSVYTNDGEIFGVVTA